MRRYEGGRVEFFDDVFDAADFEARHDAVENVAFFRVFAGASQTAAAFVDGYAAMQAMRNRLFDGFVFGRDYRDCRVLFDAVNDEVNGLRGGDIRQNRIESRFDSEKIHRGEKNKNVKNQNDIADFQQMAVAADEQSRDFRAVQNRAAANRQTDARADK